jgi:hypothetical protein
MTMEQSPIRIGFTGHQGLTPQTSILIGTAIDEYLAELDHVIGICSLAEGADQLFAECVLNGSNQLLVIVPSFNYEKTFYSFPVRQNYHQLLTRAVEVIQLAFLEPSEEAFYAAGLRVVAESERMIAVWDGLPSGGLGGTADIVSLAEQMGKSVERIWPAGASRS